MRQHFPSVHPFASEEEFRSTEDTVSKFQGGVGKELHQKLLQRAKSRRNWVCIVFLNQCFLHSWLCFAKLTALCVHPQLEEWWLDCAYLEVRIPSQLFVNFAGPAPYLEHCWPPAEGTQLERASISTWHTLQYWNMIRT